MFSHVVAGTNDLERAKRFYDAVLFAASVRLLKQTEHRNPLTAFGDVPFHPVARCLAVLV